jgi:hypothetical protein
MEENILKFFRSNSKIQHPNDNCSKKEKTRENARGI